MGRDLRLIGVMCELESEFFSFDVFDVCDDSDCVARLRPGVSRTQSAAAVEPVLQALLLHFALLFVLQLLLSVVGVVGRFCDVCVGRMKFNFGHL